MTLKHLALMAATTLIRAVAEVIAQQAARYMVRLLRRMKWPKRPKQKPH